jgi:hypothetical protein
VRSIKERKVGHVMVIYDGPSESRLLLSKRERSLQGGQGPIGVMHDHLGTHFGYEKEFAFAEFRGIAAEEVWRPKSVYSPSKYKRQYLAIVSGPRSQQA